VVVTNFGDFPDGKNRGFFSKKYIYIFQNVIILQIFPPKWRKFTTKKVSGYVFEILNKCVAFERLEEGSVMLQITRCCP
jgi:hypothetical protein